MTDRQAKQFTMNSMHYALAWISERVIFGPRGGHYRGWQVEFTIDRRFKRPKFRLLRDAISCCKSRGYRWQLNAKLSHKIIQ
jgi:hypothetical protein